jgi:hypothetical protein
MKFQFTDSFWNILKAQEIRQAINASKQVFNFYEPETRTSFFLISLSGTTYCWFAQSATFSFVVSPFLSIVLVVQSAGFSAVFSSLEFVVGLVFLVLFGFVFGVILLNWTCFGCFLMSRMFMVTSHSSPWLCVVIAGEQAGLAFRFGFKEHEF